VRALKMLLEYDGTGFAGWQRQRNAPSVQETVEDALAAVLPRRVSLAAAGRTDRGVHALGQVAVFRTDGTIPTERLPFAVNHHLPPEVRVRHCGEVDHDFHACRDATAKHYRYTIWCGSIPPALWGRFATAVPYDLDLTAMREAAAAMEGRHDFRAFRTWAKGQEHLDTVKTMYRVVLDRRETWLVVDVLGSGFLYTQVRTMVGTLVDVGRGRTSAPRLGEILASGDRRLAGPTFPPQGLCLMQVFYGSVPEFWRQAPGPVVWIAGPPP
jgi:tRNA pseudouridine38-40 synthase